MNSHDDFYKRLGVTKNASDADIKSAFKALSRKMHPDVGGNEKDFQLLSEAWDSLKTPEKRAAYDIEQSMPTGHPGQGGGHARQQQWRQAFDGQFADIFNNAQYRVYPSVRHIQINITLEEAFAGCVVDGIPLPPGVRNGERRQKTSSSPQEPDTIYTILYTEHLRYQIDQLNNLHEVKEIDVVDCILGTTIVVNTICGKSLKVAIPEYSNEHTVLKLPKFGMNHGNRRGTLFIHVKPLLPKHLTSSAKELYKKIRNKGDE